MKANFVIMGLPSSGKTTFLAALWHLIEADQTDCRLKLDRYEGDLKYLNSISQAWRTFKPVPRTSQVGDVDIAIYLEDSETGAKGRAFFPDLAGETFDTQVEARRCRPKFLSNVDDGDGILFFISANLTQDGLSIVELNQMLPSEIETETPGETQDAITAPGKSPQFAEWVPKMIINQARIVQILTDLQRRPFAVHRRRLAILISAWDLLGATTSAPDEWLETNLPLVYQFIRSNTDSFEIKVYGVSAQGVDLGNKAAVAEAGKLPASARISILGENGKGHDITTPLVWLMSDR
ncbi:hypothetical protein [Burkholderia gladioli]|uniref:TRAFAC clade GTPase domain-containing protein n=1 Tax=Burkholderia gladioli TaxID=28095 RepID=UPI000D00C8EF|nr:hypothetical protein [Burkholderia gladioli]MBU9270267.1 hypothetical protein [Burkholderia gladioli]MBU9273041.1 hypothetical protein [Burkholderia gladioli]PRE16788.1 hypothetical protein C6P72_23850 [Burkholderia gladioli]